MLPKNCSTKQKIGLFIYFVAFAHLQQWNRATICLMHLMNADTITIALNNFIAWKWCCFPLFNPYHWAYQISVNRMKKCVLFSGQTQWHHESTLVSKLTRKKENSLHRFRKTLAPNDRGRGYIEKFKIHLNFSWNWILLWNIIGCFSILRLHCLLCSWWFWLQANFFEFFFSLFTFIQGIHAENRI